MGKSQPTYTKEFKQQAATLFETSGKSKTQITRDFGISDSSLANSAKNLEHEERTHFQGKDIKLQQKKKIESSDVKMKYSGKKGTS